MQIKCFKINNHGVRNGIINHSSDKLNGYCGLILIIIKTKAQPEKKLVSEVLLMTIKSILVELTKYWIHLLIKIPPNT